MNLGEVAPRSPIVRRHMPTAKTTMLPATASRKNPLHPTRLDDGRQAYLQQKRDATRAAILRAAREVFAGSSYVHARIDDFITRAGVSRATFYAHFESKLDLAYAIYEEIIPQSNALFATLPEAVEGGIEPLIGWLRAFVALHDEHSYVTPLIAQLQLFEASFRTRILADSEATLDRLGFSPEASLSRRIRARLTCNSVAATCAQIARGELPVGEIQVTLEQLAHEMHALFHRPQELSTPD